MQYVRIIHIPILLIFLFTCRSPQKSNINQKNTSKKDLKKISIDNFKQEDFFSTFQKNDFYPNRPLPEDIIEKEKPRIKKSTQASQKTSRSYGVIYSGNEFIRQKKYHPLIGKKEMIMTIRGNGKISKGTTSLYSNIIHVIGDKGLYAEIPYSIYVYDHKEKLAIRAGYGIYDKESKKVLLSKKPSAQQKDKDGSIILNSYQMEWNLDERTLKAIGQVHIKTPDYIMECDLAIWNEKDNTLYLTGNPVIREEKSYYKADSMTYFRKDKRAELLNNALFVIVEIKETKDKEPSSKKEPINVTTKIKSEKSIIHHGENVRYGRKIDFFSSKNGWVNVKRENFTLQAKKVIAWGEKPEEMFAWNTVHIEDLENQSYAFSQMAKYFDIEEKKNKIIMESIPDTDFKPLIMSYKKDKEHNKKLIENIFTAHYLERDLNEEKTHARGEVELYYFSEEKPVFLFNPFNQKELFYNLKKTTPSLLSEWAESFDKNKVTYFHGNPQLKEGANSIYASQIIYYNETQILRLAGPVNGHLINQPQ